MKYKIKFTSRFKKDLKQTKKQGKDIEKLFEIIEKLAKDEILDEKYRDHSLTGNYKGSWEHATERNGIQSSWGRLKEEWEN